MSPPNVSRKILLLERTTAKVLGTPSRPGVVKFADQAEGLQNDMDATMEPQAHAPTQGSATPSSTLNSTRLLHQDNQMNEATGTTQPTPPTETESPHTNAAGRTDTQTSDRTRATTTLA